MTIHSRSKSNIMKENKLPDFEFVDYFDTHDMGDHFEEMVEVEFDIDIKRHRFLIEVDEQLMKKLAKAAKAQHITTGQLVNK